MRTKQLFLMAAMLLMSVCTFAQHSQDGDNTVGTDSPWKNLVLNSDLEGDDLSCFFKTENLAEDEETIPAAITDGAGMDNSRGIVIQSVDDPVETWNTQFFVRLTQSLPVGTRYRMSFDYKASKDADAKMEIHNEPHEYILWYFDWGEAVMSFTSSWQHYECEGIVTDEMSTDENTMRTIAFDLAHEPSATTYYFDNIVFEIDTTPILTVGVQNVTIMEGDDIPDFTLTYSGWVNGDTEDNAFITKPIAYTPATSFSIAGSYPIIIYGGEAPNYYLSYKSGTLTILPSGNYNNIVLNSDLEGDDMSCFFMREDLDQVDEIIPAAIIDGVGMDNSRGIVVQSVDNPSETWNTQFFVRLPIALRVGTKYRISFDYKASQNAYVNMEVHAEPGTFIYWDSRRMLYEPSWQHYEFGGIVTEVMSTDENMMRTIAFDLANIHTATTYYFDNIVFEIDESQLEPSVIITADNAAYGADKSEIVVRKNKTVTLTPMVYPTTLEDKSVKWKSSDKTIATVSSSGTLKGVKTGTATITCTSVATGAKATCKVIVGTITLDQTNVVVKKNKTVTLTPTVYPTTLADKSVIWESSDESIATVTSGGKVKGVKTGIATITCTSVATGLSTTCTVTVGTITLDQTNVVVKKNKTVTLTPTVYPLTLEDKSVKWKSSDKTIATVSSSGKVKGVKTGTVTITCTSVATGLSTTCTVTVGTITLDQTNVVIKKNKTVKLTPTVYPTTLEDKSVKWQSSDKTIATVTSTGTVKGLKTGTVTITCTSVATGLSATCTVIVGTITLSKSSATVTVGSTVTLKPTVYPTTLEDKSVTWKSSDETTATVTEDGKVTGKKAGTATITCTSVATGLSTTCKVTVKASASARTLDEEGADVTGIETIDENPAIKEPVDVYDLGGRQVLQRATSLDGLPAGVYIVNGKKMLKK
jgi:uncharacterized protein YjdB